MNNLKLALIGPLASVLLVACAPESSTTSDNKEADAATKNLESLDQRFSYAFGMNVGEQVKQMQAQEINVDIDLFVQGLRDTYGDKEKLLSDEQVQQTITEFQQNQREKQMAMQEERKAEMEAAGAANKKAGEEFLAANAEKEGVVVTDSGLQYKVITAGEGAKPAATDRVTVHYRGRLLDGTEFDSSYSRNEPATFALNQVIPGWTEGVQLMPEGSKYELYIPSELAYGAGGSGKIGPNSTLIFEVELLKIESDN